MANDKKYSDSNGSNEPSATPRETASVSTWAERLKERARAIGMTDIAVARRVGLAQSRYASYVGGKREPDFQTFLKICEALGTRPDIILGLESSNSSTTAKEAIRVRVISALEALDAQGQRLALASLEGMAEVSLPEARAKPQTPKPSRRHLT